MKSADGGAPDPSSAIRQGALAAAVYCLLLLPMAYPISVHPASMTAPGDPDTDLFMWTLAWNTHALTHAPWTIFDANIYHPHRFTLAFSENLIGSTLFAAPVLWLTGSHVLALNTVSFTSVVLCGLGAWLLARTLGLRPPAACLAGLIFAFSPARFLRFGQLHLTTIQWMPFALAFLHGYVRHGRRRDLRMAAGFFTLQVLTSGHGATFLTVAILLLLTYRVLLGEPLAIRRRLSDLGIPGALLLAPAAAVLLPYRAVQVEHALRRDLIGWAPSPQSFLASPSNVHLWLLSQFPDAQVVERASAWLFPGFLPLLLASAALMPPVRAALQRSSPARIAVRIIEVAIALSLLAALWVSVAGPVRLTAGTTVLLSLRDPVRPWIWAVILVLLRIAFVRRIPVAWRASAWRAELASAGRRWRESPVRFYALLLAVALLLASGPPLGLWPLVYSLPGFNFIRVPSRFVLLAMVALSILAAFGVQRLAGRFGPRRQWAIAGLLGVLMLMEFLTIPMPAARETRVDIPTADRWLAAQPRPFAIVEVPTNTYERLQSTYMLHSMAHWQRTVNGHSGMRSRLHADLYERLAGFPNPDVLSRLTEIGVTFAVVHPALYDPGAWAAVGPELERYPDWLELVYDDGRDRVYRLRAAQQGP